MSADITGHIDSWLVDQASKNEYVIMGFIRDDVYDRWPDGTFFHTSGIANKSHPVHALKPGSVVKTRNSTYVLGEPFKAKELSEDDKDKILNSSK